MPSDRALERVLKRVESNLDAGSSDGLFLVDERLLDDVRVCLSAAATARPDWEAIARELKELREENERLRAIVDRVVTYRRRCAISRVEPTTRGLREALSEPFGRASLGEGSREESR